MDKKLIESLQKQRDEFSSNVVEKNEKIGKLNSEIEEFKLKISAIDQLIGPKSVIGTIREMLGENVGELEYPITGSYKLKILFALSKLGEATVQQIVDLILEKQPELERELIHKNITLSASAGAKAGQLIARRDGIKNVYTLDPEYKKQNT